MNHRDSDTRNRSLAVGLILLLTIAAALITYKTTAALAVIQSTQKSGTFRPRPGVFPLSNNTLQPNALQRSFNYFLIVAPALIFGILLSGTVRVLMSPELWSRLMGTGFFRPQLIAGAAGIPLMLCSCCAAPIFSSMYERSSRVGPPLATILAAPSLNPFALLLTFMLFGSHLGIVRAIVAVLTVFLTPALVERVFRTRLTACPVDREETKQSTVVALLQSWFRVAVRTVPLILFGVLISMLIAEWLPIGAVNSTTGKVVLTIVIALIAVPLAMPTFFEIPLALILLSAGAPPAAALAMLIAGPAINLPSLLTIGYATNWKVAGTVALSVFLLALFGSLLVGIL
jgi:uncharacterized protein